jgi:uncharacterized protein (DUF2141 family)
MSKLLKRANPNFLVHPLFDHNNRKIAIFAVDNSTLMRFIPGVTRIFSAILPVSILLWLVYSCATIVAPSGGDKDVTPPKLVYSLPKNKSANFSGKKLILGFSEYIQLKDMDKNLLISPPLNSDPDFKIKGRSLTIKLKDTLRSNTTYSFYFGDGIVDLTEGNPLKNFSLAFSTGDVIDSLSLTGKVNDAFTRLPVKDILVMLYTDLADSAPILQRPVYVSRTNETGEFTLGSLAAGKYRIVALKDGNNDYMYNLPTELIAFADYLVEPFYVPQAVTDSLNNANDTIKKPVNDTTVVLLAPGKELINDTSQVLTGSGTEPPGTTIRAVTVPGQELLIDSSRVVITGQQEHGNDSINAVATFSQTKYNDSIAAASKRVQKMVVLDLFSEPDSTQRVLKGSMIAPHQMLLAFRYPTRNPEIKPLNIDSSRIWSIREFTRNHDSLSCWLIGNLPDSLKLKVTDNGNVIDTLDVPTLFKLKTNIRKTQAVDSVLKFYTVTTRSMFLDWNSEYLVTLANPLASFDAKLVRLVVSGNPDTLSPLLEYADGIQRKVRIRHPWKTGEDYTLLFPAGTFRDIYGQVNDSAKSAFKLRSKDEYGVFRLQVKDINNDFPVIIQLLTEKGAVVQEQTITQSQKVDFGFLPPAKYGLKAIYDKNGNGKWDTGIFLKKQQPEKVAIHPKLFEVRGNWELEEEWEL